MAYTCRDAITRACRYLECFELLSCWTQRGRGLCLALTEIRNGVEGVSWGLGSLHLLEEEWWLTFLSGAAPSFSTFSSPCGPRLRFLMPRAASRAASSVTSCALPPPLAAAVAPAVLRGAFSFFGRPIWFQSRRTHLAASSHILAMSEPSALKLRQFFHICEEATPCSKASERPHGPTA